MDDPVTELARAIVIGLQQIYIESGKKLTPQDAEAAIAEVLRRHLVMGVSPQTAEFMRAQGFSPLGGFPFAQRAARWPGV